MWQALIPAVTAGIGAVSSYFGGKSSEDAAKKASKKDYENAKEFAQNQIQWRTQDAVKAGLHPLVGAGISPSSGPPGTQVGDMGTAISNMGANISRGVDAMLKPEDKIAAQAALLDLEQRQANIDLTRSQIAGAQKALLSTGATAGVASSLSSSTSPVMEPIPGSTDKFKVNLPGYGQRMEDHYGDVAGSVPGAIAGLHDFASNVGLNPNDPIGSLATRFPPSMLGAFLWNQLVGSASSYKRNSRHSGGGGGW